MSNAEDFVIEYFNTQPMLMFNADLAKKIGLSKAIVFQQVNYWIQHNKEKKINYFDGRYWCFNSIKEWRENNFCFMSEKTIERSFDELKENKIIVTRKENRNGKIVVWYTIDYKILELLLSGKIEWIESSKQTKCLNKENGETDKMSNNKQTKSQNVNRQNVREQIDKKSVSYNIYNKYNNSNTEITSDNTNNDYNAEITRRTETEKEIKKKKPYIVLPDIPDAKPCEKNMDRDSKLFDMYANIRIKAMNVFKYDIESAKIITKVLENVCRTYEAETKYKHGIICGEGNIEKSIQFVIDNAKQLTAVIEQYQVFVNTHKSDYLHCQFTDFVNEFTERTA